MNLINADELRKRMYHEAFETNTDRAKWESGLWIRYKMFEDKLEECKTVEAEPVRHGHWEAIINAYGEVEGFVHAECGHTSYSKGNYCSNCGCKMGEVENEKNR